MAYRQSVATPEIDLAHFRTAFDQGFRAALGELRAGRKRTHWMWWAFPQIAGLGTSPNAVRYAIATREHAAAFLRDPDLRAKYLQLVDAVWQQVVVAGTSLDALFGWPDDVKLVSSLTLFEGTARRLDHTAELDRFIEQAGDILAAAAQQGLARCERTERFLSEDDGPDR